MIANKDYFSEGDVVVLGKSDKDVGDTRYARAQSYAEIHNPGVNVEEMVFPMIGGKNMGGTALRNMIAADQKERFLSKIPKHLLVSEIESAWNIVTNNNNSLNSYIDTTIEEMTTMGAGAVEGSPGGVGFGPPNTHNVFNKRRKNNPNKRAKSKRPKVKRAKRQRRR